MNPFAQTVIAPRWIEQSMPPYVTAPLQPAAYQRAFSPPVIRYPNNRYPHNPLRSRFSPRPPPPSLPPRRPVRSSPNRLPPLPRLSPAGAEIPSRAIRHAPQRAAAPNAPKPYKAAAAAIRRGRLLHTRRRTSRWLAQRNGATRLPSRPGELQARYRRRLLQLVNAERARYGVRPVMLDATLTACARRHNADLAFVQQRLSHVGYDGAGLSERLHRCGYSFRYASENIARGQGDPGHVVRSWMRSPGHRKNLLNPRATHMGVHVGRGTDGRLYWAQLFGNLK